MEMVPALVCINKADLYPEGSDRIEAWCHSHQIEVAGKIPFDASVIEAMRDGKPITSFQSQAAVSQAIVHIWKRVIEKLDLEEISVGES